MTPPFFFSSVYHSGIIYLYLSGISSRDPSVEKNLTEKQADLLHFVENYWNERYCAPTYKEIAENLGVKSVGWVHSLVNSLVSKGILVKKGHRTLRPVHLTQKSLDKKL